MERLNNRLTADSRQKRRKWSRRLGYLVALSLAAAGTEHVTALSLIQSRMNRISATYIGTGSPIPGHIGHKNNLNTRFFTTEGHIPYLEAMLQTTDIGSITRNTVHQIAAEPDRFTRLGDTFELFVKESHLYFSQQYPQHISSDFETALEGRYNNTIVGYALTSAAAGINPYQRNFADYYGYPEGTFTGPWNRENGFMRIFPGILPVEEQLDVLEYGGKDRAAHLIHHAFLTYWLDQSYMQHNYLHLQTPVGIRYFAEAGFPETFTWMAGHAYEAKMLYRVINDGLTPPFSDGYCDAELTFDLEANRLGQSLGYQLSRGEISYSEFIKLLNNEALYVPRSLDEVDSDSTLRNLCTFTFGE